MRKLQLWRGSFGLPGRTAERARRTEDEGWDGLSLVDSQSLAGDPFVELGAAAGATSTLLLGTGVTNPVTRHVATMANAAACLQLNSGGRFVLGIGRGDSALAHLGLAPAPVPYFEHYLKRLRPLLRGEGVPFDLDADNPAGRLRPVEALGLAETPTATRLRWLRSDLPPTPIDVTGTGPKVITLGARHGDQLSFAVGTDPARVKAVVDLARAERIAAGRGGETFVLGMYAAVLPIEDRDLAIKVGAGAAAAAARFSVMHGTVSGAGTDERHTDALLSLHKAYDMTQHVRSSSPQAAALSTDLIESYCVLGPPSYCVDRLLQFADLGIGRIVIQGAAAGGDRETTLDIERTLIESVLPHIP